MLQGLVEQAGKWIWGPPLILAMCAVGVLFSCRLRWVQVRRLPRALKLLVSADTGEGEVSRLGALSTSLAAMIGTGNIVGVATAVAAGGAGAVFWMWIAAFFGMATSYAEGLLAVKYRRTDDKGHILGGAFYYIERGMGRKFKWLASSFAWCGVLAAIFGIGTVTQMNGIAAATRDLLQTESPWVTAVTAVVATALIAHVIFGGIGRISHVAVIVVPVMGSLFVFATLAVLVTHADRLPNAFMEIFSSALTGRAAFGGVSGTLVLRAIRMGVSRGVFSNEAGLGSTSIAAAAARAENPVEQGLVSMTGTFIDTIVLCTLTGLAIVVTEVHRIPFVNGVALTSLAYDAGLPGLGGRIVSLSLILFAFSSVLGWNYYGERCAAYLGGTRAILPYRMLYLAMLFSGAFLHVDLVWGISDCFNGLMAVPNLIALVALSGVVVRETKKYNG